MQPPWKNVGGCGDLKPNSKPSLYGIRKSCEPCRRRKKKCNGERPCRRCLRSTGRDECTYSKRSWHLPSPQRQQQQQPDPSGAYERHIRQHSTSEAARTQGMLSFKRCRLSASPATGLVGMRENAFLSDFFSCVGFMPFTTRSYIRETMVKLMATPAILQPPGAVPCHGAGVGPSGSTATDDACGCGSGAMDPSSCVFWCAVAVGALAKGSPMESVFHYCQLARHGLGSSSGPVNGERARAWTILAYLYLFCGNTDLFQEYLALSESFLRTSVEQRSSEMPVGFADMVDYRMTVKICCGDADTDEVASFCAPVQSPPELNEAATESELYAFVMRSYRVFERAVYETEYSPSETTGGEDVDDVECGSEDEQAKPRLTGPSEEVLNAMIVSLKENQVHFERLEEAADRPSIRSGIGGLMINGNLFFEKAAKGDRIGKCVEVFERFPGVCRLTLGAHSAHMTAAALAAMDGCKPRELYGTLRMSYNSTRLPGTVALPPLEEWQGISPCCEYFYCRTMERLLSSKEMGITSNGIDSDIHRQEGVNDEVDESLCQDGHMSGLGSSHFALEATHTPLLSSCCNGKELDVSYKHEGSTGSSAPLQNGAERRMTPNRAPASHFAPNDGTQAELNVDLGGDGGALDGRPIHAGEMFQAPESSLASPDISQWGGMGDGSGSEYGLAAEDWLDAAHALFDNVADPSTQLPEHS